MRFEASSQPIERKMKLRVFFPLSLIVFVADWTTQITVAYCFPAETPAAQVYPHHHHGSCLPQGVGSSRRQLCLFGDRYNYMRMIPIQMLPRREGRYQYQHLLRSVIGTGRLFWETNRFCIDQLRRQPGESNDDTEVVCHGRDRYDMCMFLPGQICPSFDRVEEDWITSVWALFLRL